MSPHVRVVSLVALSLLGAGCALPIQRHGDSPVAPNEAGYASELQVKFLGVAGFLIRRGDDVVLTAPLYSNPDLATELFGAVRPDVSRLHRFHPADAPAVDAILVGHAHYDHLMDVPYVWQLRPGGAIYGNSSMRNILLAYDGQQPAGFATPVPDLRSAKLVALDDPADPAHYKVDTRNCAGQVASSGRAGSECDRWPAQDGDWEYVKPTLRIRALCARHPPQFLWFHQAPGCVRSPRGVVPERADEYLEGRPLTYLIDFLDAPYGAPAFRVYFQDVPSDGALGQVSEILLRERRVDVALLCAGNWSQVEKGDAASIVRNLRPQHVVLGHWEDFFRSQDEPLREAPVQKIGEYRGLVARELRSLRCPAKPTVSLPAPQVLNVFARQARSCE